MKSIAAFASLTVFSASAFAATPSETLTAFHAALHAGDKAAAAAKLSDQVVIYEAGHVERSRDEYAGHHLGGDIAFARTTTRKVLKHSERIDGNLAVVLDETETTGTWQGKPVHSFGTETALLEKKGDAWVVVHFHWSSRKAK